MSETTGTTSTYYLPWSITLAGLIAAVANYFAAQEFITATFFAILLSSYASTWRLPSTGFPAWAVRALAFTVIIILHGIPEGSLSGWYVQPEYTILLNKLLAAELAIRAWSHVKPEKVRQERGIALVVTAMMMIPAANVHDREPMQMMAPIYMLSVLLALRTVIDPASMPKRRRIGGMVIRTVATAIALALAFTLVYLVTTYERQVTNWAMNLFNIERSRSTEVGLSSSPRLQATFNLGASLSRVMLIEGTASEQHVRAMAFDIYDSEQWLPPLQTRSFYPEAERLRGSKVGKRVRMVPVGDTLRLLPMPLDVSAVECSVALERDEHSVVRYVDPKQDGTGYEVWLPTQNAFQGPLAVAPNESQLRQLLGIPYRVDKRVLELGRKVAGAGDPMSRVARIAQHLNSNHQYSLSYEPEGEPLSDFVLNKRAAHCQYFASALVVMSRAAGVPARYVTGFYAHERDGDNRLVVRDRDAHAWAEVWIDGTGWITMDATPAGGRPDALFKQPSWLRRQWEKISDIPRIIREWFNQFTQAQIITMLAIFAITWTGIWLLQQMRKRRGLKPEEGAYPIPHESLGQLARRFERWMRRRKIPVQTNRTWRESIGEHELGGRFVSNYDAVRFGEHDETGIRELSKMMNDLESEPESSGDSSDKVSPGDQQGRAE